MSRRWQRKDLHPVPRAYALEHFSNAGRAGQRGGAADVRGSLATQDPPPAEECPLLGAWNISEVWCQLSLKAGVRGGAEDRKTEIL